MKYITYNLTGERSLQGENYLESSILKALVVKEMISLVTKHPGNLMN